MEVTEKTSPSGHKIYELSGVIDESVDFTKLNGTENLNIFRVDLFGVKRINSVGIKKWMLFFEQIAKRKVRLYFDRVSPAIVEQMVNISNFRNGGEVASVVLPFQCRGCQNQNFFVKTKEELKGVDLEKVNWCCTHCGKAELEFDDLADEYLSFWGT